MNRNRVFLAALLLSLTAGACTTADAAPKGEISYLVTKREAPAYLIAKGNGVAQLYVNASTGANDVAVSTLTFAPGTNVPEHKHDGASETLYIERGGVEMTIGGKKLTAHQGDTIYIPAGILHSAKVLGPVDTLKAVQVYVGPGSEQRFAKGKPIAPR